MHIAYDTLVSCDGLVGSGSDVSRNGSDKAPEPLLHLQVEVKNDVVHCNSMMSNDCSVRNNIRAKWRNDYMAMNSC